MADNWLELTAAIDHAAAPPVGSVEVRTLPAESTATHNEAVGHDTAVKRLDPSRRAYVHFQPLPAGSLDAATSPAPTATHS
jgi:hypothetical protein